MVRNIHLLYVFYHTYVTYFFLQILSNFDIYQIEEGSLQQENENKDEWTIAPR